MAVTDCEPQKEQKGEQLPKAQQHTLVQDRNLARKLEQERRRREAVSSCLLPADPVSTSVVNKKCLLRSLF